MLDLSRMTNAALLTFCTNYKAKALLEPEDYNLTATMVAGLVNDLGQFQAKLAISNDPTTRTKASIAGTKTARKSLVALVRKYVKQTRAKVGISDETLESVGLTPYAHRSGHRPAPVAGMVFRKVTTSGWEVKIAYNAAGSLRAKAPSSIGANFYTHVGPTPPTDISAFKFEGLFTTGTIVLSFDTSLPPGTPVWISACWVGSRGEVSAALPPVRINLQAGGVGVASSDDAMKIAA